MKTAVFRLKPGQDLRESLDAFVRKHKIEAACILTCVGSLRRAVLRLADADEYRQFDSKFEIVSLTGTVSMNGSHCHISLSDSTGETIGGHLVGGCLIYTTAEIVLGILPGVKFVREIDPETGYGELVVWENLDT